DVVLHVGTRLIDLTTGSHSLFQDPGVRFIGGNARPRDAHKLGAGPGGGGGRQAILRPLDGWRAHEEWRARALAERARWERALDADLEPRDGERMSQAQVLRALNEGAGPEDRLLGGAGSP